jgi:diguanylate cyclase (GGDEF)-like protein
VYVDWLNLHFATDLSGAGLTPVECHYSPTLVVLSYLIASAAAYTTLSLVNVAIADSQRSRILWRCIGALCLGGGIWAMHFLAMVAYHMPVHVSYDHRLTVASLGIAIVTSLLSLCLISRPDAMRRDYLIAALSIGAGIAGMHYVGMAAINSVVTLYYNPWLFGLSIATSLMVSVWAMMLLLSFRRRDASLPLTLRIIGSLGLGSAIVSMHYCGMAAATFVLPKGSALPATPSTSSSTLGLATAFIALIIIGCALVAAWAGRKLEAQRQDLERVNALVEELASTQASLHDMAHLDALTGLHNRRSFNQEVPQRLGRHKEQGSRMALMFLDLDKFKRINDSLGHDAGDELLRVVAHRLRSVVRDTDMVARLGGDEFCILADVESDEEAEQLARRLLRRMKEPIALSGRTLVVTTSVGVALFPEDGDNCTDLMKSADMALYRSKAAGRDALSFFSERFRSEAALELELEEALRQALEDNALTLHYQPVFDLASGRIIQIEALLRWPHPEYGLLLPPRFIDIAQANGFVADLDHWAIRQACNDLVELHRQGFAGLRVSVNCSARSLERDAIVQQVEAALAAAALEPGCLELEIAEDALMSHLAELMGRLHRLRALGVRLSVDDFGTGQSSLAHLSRLPLDALKVDSSFIRDIPHDQRDHDVAEAIIAMGHKLHLKVIAEGVETAQQVAFLVRNQCDFAQGYLPGRPLPLDALTAVLREPARRFRLRANIA